MRVYAVALYIGSRRAVESGCAHDHSRVQVCVARLLKLKLGRSVCRMDAPRLDLTPVSRGEEPPLPEAQDERRSQAEARLCFRDVGDTISRYKVGIDTFASDFSRVDKSRFANEREYSCCRRDKLGEIKVVEHVILFS